MNILYCKYRTRFEMLPAKQSKPGDQWGSYSHVIHFGIFAAETWIMFGGYLKGLKEWTILLCGQVGNALGPISSKENVNTLVPEMVGI